MLWIGIQTDIIRVGLTQSFGYHKDNSHWVYSVIVFESPNDERGGLMNIYQNLTISQNTGVCGIYFQ